jgi:hypothetical protein
MADTYPMADLLATLPPSASGHINYHQEERKAWNNIKAFVSAFGVAPVDLFAIGGSDDAKIAAAMAYADGLTYKPKLGLGNRLYNFSTSLGQPYDGFHLEGCGKGQLGIVSSGHPNYKTSLKLEIPRAGSGLPGYWINATTTAWDYWIGGFNAYSDNGFTQMYRAPVGGGGFRECNFHDQAVQNFYSVFGNVSEGCAMTICNVTGGWYIAECRSQGVTIQGSDCRKIFSDGVDWYSSSAPSGSTGLSQWMGEFRSLGKSNVGPIYITAFNGWRGLKITGVATAGLLTIDGAVIEGNNAKQPCHGSLVRVESGNVCFRSATIDDGMGDPTGVQGSPYSNTGAAQPATNIPDRALVEVLAGAQATFDTCGFAHGNQITNPPASYASNNTAMDMATPVIYNGSTKCRVVGTQTFTRGPGWGTQLPVVKGVRPLGTDIDDGLIQYIVA